MKTARWVYDATFAIEKRLKSFERIFIKNPTVIARLRDVGVLSKEEAINFGVVGPFLRASGVEYDVRIVEPYEAYEEVTWDIVTADEGDGYARFLVRVNEVSQSLSIIRQCITSMPEGSHISEQIGDIRGSFFDKFADLVLPAGEYTTLTEGCKRHLGLYNSQRWRKQCSLQNENRYSRLAVSERIHGIFKG